MAGEFWENLRQRLPGILARGHGDQFRVRMVQEQLHQDFAGISRRADDGDFLHFHFHFFYTAETQRRRENFSNKKPCRIDPAGFENIQSESTLRELEALARTRLAVFLALA